LPLMMIDTIRRFQAIRTKRMAHALLVSYELWSIAEI
jgi:hypothetical protein